MKNARGNRRLIQRKIKRVQYMEAGRCRTHNGGAWLHSKIMKILKCQTTRKLEKNKHNQSHHHSVTVSPPSHSLWYVCKTKTHSAAFHVLKFTCKLFYCYVLRTLAFSHSNCTQTPTSGEELPRNIMATFLLCYTNMNRSFSVAAAAAAASTRKKKYALANSVGDSFTICITLNNIALTFIHTATSSPH